MVKNLIKNVLVAINGSKSSIEAAKYAIILAKQNKFNLKVIYVVDTQTLKFLTNSKYLISSESADYEQNLEQDGKNYLEYVSNLAKSKGLLIETELLKGSISSEILKTAQEIKADLILIGGKQSSQNNYSDSYRYKHKIELSVKTEILELAECPVMIVHKSDINDLFKIF